MLLRNLSQASQSFASKPMLTEVSLLLEELTLAMSNRLFYSLKRGKASRDYALKS